jgi:hypothetical protein
VLPGWFPHLPDRSRTTAGCACSSSCSRACSSAPARWLDSGGARLADGTLLEVANYPGCASRSGFAGTARYGYAKSQHRHVYGVRLVLVADRRGLQLGLPLVAANERQYEPVADLLTGTPAAVLVADKASGVEPTAPGSQAPARTC